MAGLPWPEGDPADLKDAAAKARDVATAVRQAGQRLSKAAPSGDDWKGKAASSFVSAVTDDGRDLERAAGSFTSVAGALSKLATVLDDAQDDVKRWARKVKEAEEKARKAEERASDAADKLEAAQARTNPLLPLPAAFDPLAPFTAPAESSAYQPAQAEATEAKGDLSAIRTKAKEEAGKAVEKVESADKDAAARIETAKGKAPMGGTKGSVRPGPATGFKAPLLPWRDPLEFLDTLQLVKTLYDGLTLPVSAYNFVNYLRVKDAAVARVAQTARLVNELRVLRTSLVSGQGAVDLVSVMSRSSLVLDRATLVKSAGVSGPPAPLSWRGRACSDHFRGWLCRSA